MIIVFWMDAHPLQPNDKSARYQDFKSNEMSEALKFMEHLRMQRRVYGRLCTHICMQSELDEVVGEPGVADAPADYGWYKRREDPLIPVGRPRKPTGDDLEVPLEDER